MQFKTVPFGHQLKEWNFSRDLKTRAIFWDQGTGKTKLIIDTAAWLYHQKEIDALLVMAPNGVHDNWIIDEIPVHLPDDIPFSSIAYQSKKARTIRHQAAVKEVIEAPGLAVLAVSYDAFRTVQGRRTVEKFLHQRKVLYVADESQRIKTPGAKRTISAIATGRRAQYKRILSGTPATKNPFDVYSQFRFLAEHFWKLAGFASFEAFKTHFGIWEQRTNNQTGQHFMDVVAFKNTAQLREIMAPHFSRVTKDEVLDLPPKLYTKRYFDLSPEQAKSYKEIRDEFMTILESGELLTVPLVVVRLLRLQQVICGYLPGEDGTLHRFEKNPRLEALRDLLEDVEGKAIIWARFREDIDQIMGILPGQTTVRYDGAVGSDDRNKAREGFQKGDVRFFVGNPAAAGVGLTLNKAQTVVYYSNSFDLEQRLQSEDRAHRIGTVNPVRYIDLIARGTVDTHIVKSLREKFNLAREITGDKVREWL